MLQKMSNTTHEVIRQLRALEFPVDHCNFVFVYMVHEKLDQETSKDWEFARQSETPTVNELLTFLDRQAKVLTVSQTGSQSKEHENQKRFSVSNESKFVPKRPKFEPPASNRFNEQCKALCKEVYPLHRCPKFHKLNLTQRKSFVKEKELCRNCLKGKHWSKDCTLKACLRCNIKHNSLLCPESPMNRISLPAIEQPV